MIVVIESPFAGDTARNVAYADACLFDSLSRGEAPFAGHLLYPRVWNDADEFDRNAGIRAHCAFIERADLVAVYADLGITRGMTEAIKVARVINKPIHYRELGPDWALTPIRRTPGF